MTKVILKFARRHFYTKHAPATPDLATMSGVKPEDPFAQRPVDEQGGPRMVEEALGDGTFRRRPMVPAPENVEHWATVRQYVGVFRSEDGRYELAMELMPDETLPNSIELDIPI